MNRQITSNYAVPEPENLWQEYYPKLTVYLKTFAPFQSADVQDLVQDVFVKVFSALHKYSPKYSFNTWIYTIARNHCLDVIRKKKTEQNKIRKIIHYEPSRRGEQGPEPAYLRMEAVQKIKSFIAELSDTDRQVCFLRFYEEMKLSEIAGILDEPLGTVKYRVHRIKEKLRENTADYFNFGDDDGRQ